MLKKKKSLKKAKKEIAELIEGRAQALSIKLTIAVMELSQLDKKDIH